MKKLILDKSYLIGVRDLAILLIFMLVLISSCSQDDCQTKCSKIEPSDVSPFTFNELKEKGIIRGGCYYGSIDQKAPGTPDGWIHVLEGSRSAAWCDPAAVAIENCDC